MASFMESDEDIDDLVEFDIDSVNSDKEKNKNSSFDKDKNTYSMSSEEEDFGEYDLDKEIDRLDSLSRLDKEEDKNSSFDKDEDSDSMSGEERLQSLLMELKRSDLSFNAEDGVSSKTTKNMSADKNVSPEFSFQTKKENEDTTEEAYQNVRWFDLLDEVQFINPPEEHKSNRPQPLPKEIKLTPGMDTTIKSTENDAVLTKYNGLKIANQNKNDCFLITAVNNIFGNEAIMTEVNNLPSLRDCYQRMLDENLEEEYLTKVYSDAILRELVTITNSEKEVRCVVALKRKLAVKYSKTSCYQSNTQEDAGMSYLNIINCLPNLAEKFQIIAKTTLKCSACDNPSEERMDDSISWINLEYSGPDRHELQQKIEEWCDQIEVIKKRCVCKKFINGKQIEEKKVPSTEHSKRYEVVGVPQILYIKIKNDEDGRKADINFSQFINMRGTRFSLQTAMIYGGNGLEGHWRSLIKETVGFGLYSDAHQPKHLTSATALNDALRMSTDVIYVQSSAGDTGEVEIENPAEEFETNKSQPPQKNLKLTTDDSGIKYMQSKKNKLERYNIRRFILDAPTDVTGNCLPYAVCQQLNRACIKEELSSYMKSICEDYTKIRLGMVDWAQQIEVGDEKFIHVKNLEDDVDLCNSAPDLAGWANRLQQISKDGEYFDEDMLRLMSLFLDKDIVVIEPGKAHILFCGKQSKQFYSADEDVVMNLCKCNDRKLVIGHFFTTHYQSLIPRDNLKSPRKSSSTTKLKKLERIQKHIQNVMSKRLSANASKSTITIDIGRAQNNNIEEEKDLDEVTIVHDSRHSDIVIIESGSDEKEEDAECTEDQSTHTFLSKKPVENIYICSKLKKWVEDSDCQNALIGYKSRKYSEKQTVYVIQTVFPSTQEYIAEKLGATKKSKDTAAPHIRFIKSDRVNESSRTNESLSGLIFPDDSDIVRRILYTKYVRKWAKQLNDMEKKGEKLSKYYLSLKTLIKMVEINDDDGQEVSTNIHTLKYVKSALAIRANCIKQIEKSFISARDISITNESDTQFTKKWQEQVELILLEKGDRRQINYIWDSEGNSGKTEFIKKMKKRHPARVLEVAHASAQNMARFMGKEKDVMKKDIILLDIPKAYKFKREHYTFIEEMKDGKITISSPNGSSSFRHVANPIQICFFSNVEPAREGLSASRWIIYDLIRNKLDDDPYTMWGLNKKTITSTPL